MIDNEIKEDLIRNKIKVIKDGTITPTQPEK